MTVISELYFSSPNIVDNCVPSSTQIDPRSVCVVVVAEAVYKLALPILSTTVAYYLGRSSVAGVIAFAGLVKVVFPQLYDAEKIKEQLQDKSYVEKMRDKARFVECLSGKEQALWVLNTWKQGILSKIGTIALLMMNLYAPYQHLKTLSVFCLECSLGQDVSKAFDYCENQIHMYLYNKVQKEHDQIASSQLI